MNSVLQPLVVFVEAEYKSNAKKPAIIHEPNRFYNSKYREIDSMYNQAQFLLILKNVHETSKNKTKHIPQEGHRHYTFRRLRRNPFRLFCPSKKASFDLNIGLIFNVESFTTPHRPVWVVESTSLCFRLG